MKPVRLRGAPEEQVRQAVLQHLLTALGVPRACIQVEFGLCAIDARIRDRVDLVVLDVRSGSAQPVLLVECKAPNVPLTKDVFGQVRRYLRWLPAPWVAVTNGAQLQSWNAQDGIWVAKHLPPWERMREHAGQTETLTAANPEP